MATCASSGNISIFDLSNREKNKGNPPKVSNFKAHDGPVWAIAWAHPRYGNILASCGFDRKVNVFKEVKANDW